MNILNVKVEPARSKKITWQIIDTSNVIYWVLGISLLLVPDFFNRLIFGREVISHWIYIVMGIGSILFAIWQLDNFIKSRLLTVQALRFSAMISWLVAIVLFLILISSLGMKMLLISKVLLWLISVLTLVEGGWYWWVAEQVESS